MGILHDILLESKAEQFEKDLKEAYSMGFRDGRLCPADLRPCKVDGAPALFHRFVEEDRMILQSNLFAKPETEEKMIRRVFDTGVVTSGMNVAAVMHETRALIEWPDGRLSTVAVERVQFTDRHNGG